MKIQNFLKRKCEQVISNVYEEESSEFLKCNKTFDKRIVFGFIFVLVLGISSYFYYNNLNFAGVTISSNDEIKLASFPFAATSSSKSVISIPTGTIKANPFEPYRDLSGNDSSVDVPSYALVEPPEALNESSEAARVMDTIVSGILYDKYSPSAILNIEGSDYLVKKGDVVNNYKVINISQNSVTVKLGSNVYKAGIGEILTEGSINHNSVSNLESKFGGEK